METVFVTGGTGFIGRSLLKELLNRQEVAAVLALYRSKIPFEHEKLLWLQGDMDHLPELPPTAKLTKVLHAAALQNRGVPQKKIYADNIRWTKQIIAFAQRYAAKELIFFSSINARLKHRGAYAESKLACEKLVEHSGIRTKILRPALVYGKGENGISSLMTYIRRLPAIPVFGNGRAKEQPIYVEDLARLAARYVLDEEGAPLVELCGKEPMEYDHMLRLMAAILGKKANIIHLPFAPFYYGLRMLEKLNLILPLTSEQAAHIAEDLNTDMGPLCERYGVSLADFSEKMRDLFATSARERG